MQIRTKLMSSTYLTLLFLTYPGSVHSNETNVRSHIYALFKISVLLHTSTQLSLNDGNQMKIICLKINQNSAEMFFWVWLLF